MHYMLRFGAQVALEIWEDDVLFDDFVQSITGTTPIANSGSVYFQLPFNLAQYETKSGDLFRSTFFVKILHKSKPNCVGESKTFSLNGDASKLALVSQPAPLYDTGSRFQALLLAEAMPDRTVKCELMKV